MSTLERDKTRYVGKKKKRKEWNSQQGHWMSVFNIDLIFSSSVRYPERYVLKPEIIVCRFKEIYKTKRWYRQFLFSCCLLTDWKVPFLFYLIIRVKIKHSMRSELCIEFLKKLITLKWEFYLLTVISTRVEIDEEVFCFSLKWDNDRHVK